MIRVKCAGSKFKIGNRLLRHYLTFAHQAATLDEALNGQTLAECWSQEKNHLLLRFIRENESTFVEFAVDLQLGYALLKRDAQRARKNTIDFFQPLLGATLKHVSIDEGERVIRLHFSDSRQLVVFFFGKGSGNILLVQGDEVHDSFTKHSGEYDALIGSESHEEDRSKGDVIRRLQRSDDRPAKALARSIPELGPRLAVESLYQAKLGELSSLKEASDEHLHLLLAHVDSLYAACELSETFYLYHLPDDVVFALTRLQSLESSAEQIETFDEIGHAIHAYRSTARSVHRFAEVRARMLKRLHSEITRIERSITKRYNADEHRARADAWERDASTLLANLHLVERGSARVTLTDWEGAEREITLDPKLTPAENAEHLFKRARGAREAAERDITGREKIERSMKRVRRLIEEVERAESVKELERIEGDNQELFRMTGEAREQGTAERFRRFEVAGHEIYVGKNASNNDELTVRFARPNDYWFHARGSFGSHVVLRWNDPKSKPPKDVLRAAASLAAYYSGAKNAKMVPVAYTLKKHVRKPRGAAVGAVVMEREEVIMAEPKLPE